MINPPERIVYGYVALHDSLAFADGETAPDEVRDIRALAAARTWGAAREVTFSHGWNPADPEFDDDADDHPDDSPFDINELTAVIEGDWPKMVTGRTLDVLPEDLQEQFGNRQDTSLNGDYLEIPAAAEKDLVAALRARGHQVTRDDDLINALDGSRS
ncbi:hypothetical protein [Paractinoplanes durhamensis]|uniref:Uncharacterized protein n=1 Tax=Paractinoplanes durhamensis TaxID=113563 RepID=A0ABQ3ZBF0_9ACTN|nr:hypothetical protein [Actinoplanes durhamensis]GIE07147.1 hypothetical protein Adu01nite_84970 [Actinoplanes durhamensis]